MANRLAKATSPYLLQHKDNPVDWWEWGPEAFEEARDRNLPVLLSVGYAACHWCHVMAHESFEDERTAALMNRHFVNIKVDREERPDVDAVYMQATTAMTGHGGWPMTVVLTPRGEPFFCGTYFPDRPRMGQPSFQQVLTALAEAWRDRREEVGRVARRVREALRTASPPPAGALDEAVIEAAVSGLVEEYDAAAGGFGRAPKFPPTMVLEFLLRYAARTGRPDVVRMVDTTCEAMARGGMYDQVGGGFARYSVDRDWVVPHFEKMLYDNAQLVGLYARWWRQTRHPLGARVARETAEFLLDELRTPEGGFASALDADTEGVEGRFYVWRPDELWSVLGPDDGQWAADLLQVTVTGTFEEGASTLQLRRDPEDLARWARVRAALRDARSARTRPARDDKVVAAWNGLAVASLAEAGSILHEPAYVAAAARAARLLLEAHVDGRRLRRVSRDGSAGRHPGVLEDHGCVATGLLALFQATGDDTWLTPAGQLLEEALDRFRAPDGGFFDTAEDAEQLVARPKDPGDNASPSGQSSMVHALLTWSAITGSGRHREAAEQALGTVRVLAERAPRFAGWSLAAAEAVLAGPLEVAVVGRRGQPAFEELLAAARLAPSPGAVIVPGDPTAASAGHQPVPLLAGRQLVGGRPTAYVCRGMVCDRPVTTAEDLTRLLTPNGWRPPAQRSE